MNALSNTNSIKILPLLETRNMSAGELAEKLSLGLNTLKYNLYSLLEVGLIRISVTKWSQTERKIKICEPVEKIIVLVPGRSSAGNGSIEEFSAPDAPMTIGVNSIVVYLSTDNLTKDSDIVLTGSVKEILPARWNKLWSWRRC